MLYSLSKKPLLIILFIALFFYCFIPVPSQASIFDAITTNLGIFNQGAELPTSNVGLEGIVINIINTALSFLGLIFVCLVLYAGFLYMTAAGETKKVEKANNILRDSVIGLAIIFASYVLVNYVITEVIKLIKTA
ncbi:MAG TPA: hypothetical protein PLK76_00240 [bacterium]|nr:hypothetical protein [bacterium]